MDITLFAAVMQVAPVMRDKNYTVFEFLQIFCGGDENKEAEIIRILDTLDMIQSEYRDATWPHPSGKVYYWIFEYDN